MDTKGTNPIYSISLIIVVAIIIIISLLHNCSNVKPLVDISKSEQINKLDTVIVTITDPQKYVDTVTVYRTVVKYHNLVDTLLKMVKVESVRDSIVYAGRTFKDTVYLSDDSYIIASSYVDTNYQNFISTYDVKNINTTRKKWFLTGGVSLHNNEAGYLLGGGFLGKKALYNYNYDLKNNYHSFLIGIRF